MLRSLSSTDVLLCCASLLPHMHAIAFKTIAPGFFLQETLSPPRGLHISISARPSPPCQRRSKASWIKAKFMIGADMKVSTGGFPR